MPLWAKILVGAIVVISLAVVGTCAAGTFWLTQNQDRIAQAGEVGRVEGSAFGVGKDAQACVDEGLRRSPPAKGVADMISSAITQRMFVEGCLKSAVTSSGFCLGTPSSREVLKSATWAADRCKAIGKDGDPNCPQLMAAVQAHCAGSASPTSSSDAGTLATPDAGSAADSPSPPSAR